MDCGSCLSFFRGLFRSSATSTIMTNRDSTRPQLEQLEDRTVPSGLSFGPQYGQEQTTIGGDVLTGNVPVYVIFAGGQGAVYGQDGTVTQSQIITAVNNILNSSFLSDLSEYGAATHAYLAGTTVSNYNLPRQFTDNGNGSDINKLVNASLADEGGSLPEPDGTTPEGVYLVITPQGYSLNGEADYLGHHSAGFAGTSLDPVDAPDGVILSGLQYVPGAVPTTVNQPGATVHFRALSSLDTMTETLSHELVEILTDPDGNGSGGVATTPGSSFTANFPNQAEGAGEISDNEGEFYVGYENGTAVQSYWSNLSLGYIIPGATLQDIALNGSVLTIKGDRLNQAADDSLVLNTTASGGMQVTLDGETVQYAAGQLTQLYVSLGKGNNTLEVLGLPSGLLVNVDGSGGTTSLVGSIGSELSQVQFSGDPGSTAANNSQSISVDIPPTIQTQAGSTGNAGSRASGADSVLSQAANVAHDPGTGPASVLLDLTSAASPILLWCLFPSGTSGASTGASPTEYPVTNASSTAAADLGMTFIDSAWLEPSWVQGWRKMSDSSL
jgi:hypothetical protein